MVSIGGCIRVLVIVMLLVLLAACGGGGGGSDNSDNSTDEAGTDNGIPPGSEGELSVSIQHWRAGGFVDVPAAAVFSRVDDLSFYLGFSEPVLAQEVEEHLTLSTGGSTLDFVTHQSGANLIRVAPLLVLPPGYTVTIALAPGLRAEGGSVLEDPLEQSFDLVPGPLGEAAMRCEKDHVIEDQRTSTTLQVLRGDAQGRLMFADGAIRPLPPGNTRPYDHNDGQIGVFFEPGVGWTEKLILAEPCDLCLRRYWDTALNNLGQGGMIAVRGPVENGFDLVTGSDVFLVEFDANSGGWSDGWVDLHQAGALPYRAQLAQGGYSHVRLDVNSPGDRVVAAKYRKSGNPQTSEIFLATQSAGSSGWTQLPNISDEGRLLNLGPVRIDSQGNVLLVLTEVNQLLDFGDPERFQLVFARYGDGEWDIQRHVGGRLPTMNTSISEERLLRSDGMLAVEPNGQASVIWSRPDGDQGYEVVHSRYSPTQGGWQIQVALSEPVAPGTVYPAANSHGDLLVAWLDTLQVPDKVNQTVDPTVVVIRRYSSSTGTWSNPEPLFTVSNVRSVLTTAARELAVAIADDGRALVAYYDAFDPHPITHNADDFWRLRYTMYDPQENAWGVVALHELANWPMNLHAHLTDNGATLLAQLSTTDYEHGEVQSHLIDCQIVPWEEADPISESWP